MVLLALNLNVRLGLYDGKVEVQSFIDLVISWWDFNLVRRAYWAIMNFGGPND